MIGARRRLKFWLLRCFLETCCSSSSVRWFTVHSALAAVLRPTLQMPCRDPLSIPVCSGGRQRARSYYDRMPESIVGDIDPKFVRFCNEDKSKKTIHFWNTVTIVLSLQLSCIYFSYLGRWVSAFFALVKEGYSRCSKCGHLKKNDHIEVYSCQCTRRLWNAQKWRN